MKKFTAFMVSIIGLLILVGCSSGSNTIDNSSNNKQIAKDWLLPTVLTYETDTVNTFTEGKDHLEVRLPADIQSSLRLNVVDFPSTFNPEKQTMKISYASTTAFSESDYKTFINMITTDTVKNKISTATNGLEPFDKAITTLTPEESYIASADTNKVIGVVYMPLYVTRVTYNKKGVETINLYTYVLVPLKLSFTTTTTEGFADTTLNSYQTVEFIVKNSAVCDKTA